MSPSQSTGSPKLPDWAEGLPLSRDSKKILLRLLQNQADDVEQQIEDVLKLGGRLEKFLEEVRVIVEQGDRFVLDGMALAREFNVAEADLVFAQGAIRRHAGGELKNLVQRIQRLKELGDSLKSRQATGVARGHAVRIEAGMNDKIDTVKEQSCEDRGTAVYDIVENIYRRMREEVSLTQETFEKFLQDLSRRALQAVRVKRKHSTVREDIRDPKKRPELQAEVSRMCSLILLRDFTLRKIVKFSPVMLAALLRQTPSQEQTAEIEEDYCKLRGLPQHSRVVVFAGPLKRSFYLDGSTEAERVANIHPDVAAACTGPAPMQIIRCEFVTNEDVVALRDALHPNDLIYATIAAPHPLAGKRVTLCSTMKNGFAVVAIEGEKKQSVRDVIEEEINRQPLRLLETDFTVKWAKE